MKIGILTLHLHINYGGILQAYALQTVLQQMGHEVYLIRHINVPRWRIALKIIKKEISPLYKKGTQYELLLKQLSAFKKKHFQFIDIHQKCSKFDTIIVGSDQIWRTTYYPIQKSFLAFAQNWKIPKIAYGCSFGTIDGDFSSQQINYCKDLIKLFNGVSVREKDAIKLITQQFKWECKPIFVLDPTMLLDANHYRNLYDTRYKLAMKKKIYYYILDMTDDKREVLNNLSIQLSLDTYTCDLSQYPLENWLIGFDEAAYVFTDSFHGCALSILYNKNFIVYGNERRGISRFNSLLETFNISERLILSQSDLTTELIHKRINYDMVNSTLTDMRNKSTSFLKHLL